MIKLIIKKYIEYLYIYFIYYRIKLYLITKKMKKILIIMSLNDLKKRILNIKEKKETININIDNLFCKIEINKAKDNNTKTFYYSYKFIWNEDNIEYIIFEWVTTNDDLNNLYIELEKIINSDKIIEEEKETNNILENLDNSFIKKDNIKNNIGKKDNIIMIILLVIIFILFISSNIYKIWLDKVKNENLELQKTLETKEEELSSLQEKHSSLIEKETCDSIRRILDNISHTIEKDKEIIQNEIKK